MRGGVKLRGGCDVEGRMSCPKLKLMTCSQSDSIPFRHPRLQPSVEPHLPVRGPLPRTGCASDEGDGRGLGAKQRRLHRLLHTTF